MMAREPLSPAKQNRLKKIFEVASQKAETAEKPSDFDYATELFTQCMAGDPGNPTYVLGYLDNLQKKFGTPKNLGLTARFSILGPRNAVKKAHEKELWEDVLVLGRKALEVNPWDGPTLTALATASKKLGDFDCETCYLMTALKGNPDDAALNRLYAIALSERGLIDQAIVFWRRVEEALPGDDEPKRAIASLLVEKARSSGKFEDNSEVARKQRVKAAQQQEQSAEQRLQQKIHEDPKNPAHYVELAQFYMADDRYKEADDLWGKAFDLSDGDLEIREKWEDCQLRQLRQKIIKTEDVELKKKLQREYLTREIDVYRNRIERYPNNLGFRFELGCRYLRAKLYTEAIHELQIAQSDPRRKGECLLNLGECFRRISQYSLAMKHYEAALHEIAEHDLENRKKALYLAGALSLGLKHLEVAEKHLTALAALDFHYKDVQALLDKLNELR